MSTVLETETDSFLKFAHRLRIEAYQEVLNLEDPKKVLEDLRELEKSLAVPNHSECSSDVRSLIEVRASISVIEQMYPELRILEPSGRKPISQ
jgi:hypothetical protein